MKVNSRDTHTDHTDSTVQYLILATKLYKLVC